MKRLDTFLFFMSILIIWSCIPTQTFAECIQGDCKIGAFKNKMVNKEITSIKKNNYFCHNFGAI